jgi:predicted transcriptional regulator
LITESEVLRCISDEKSRDMLSIIWDKRSLSTARSRLTRKQYYSRLHNLIICGLIQRKNKGYQLSSFGKVIFDSHLVISDTVDHHYWKLKALDAMSTSEIPEHERAKMMDGLIENEKIKRFL